MMISIILREFHKGLQTGIYILLFPDKRKIRAAELRDHKEMERRIIPDDRPAVDRNDSSFHADP